MIFKGTTPTITLNITNADDIDFANITNPRITIQNDSGRNKKIFTNCTIDQNKKTISTKLSYDDTMSFEVGYLLVQLAADITVEENVIDKYRSPILRMEMGDDLEDK